MAGHNRVRNLSAQCGSRDSPGLSAGLSTVFLVMPHWCLRGGQKPRCVYLMIQLSLGGCKGKSFCSLLMKLGRPNWIVSALYLLWTTTTGRIRTKFYQRREYWAWCVLVSMAMLPVFSL